MDLAKTKATGVLVQTGKRIEHRALADVRIAGQRDHMAVRSAVTLGLGRTAGLPAGGGGGQTHAASPRFPQGRTSTAAASSFRSAMTVPRIW